MKWFFLSLFLFAQNTFGEDHTWVQKIISSQMGSCETNDLSFTSLRFTKIPLSQNNLFLRVLLFVRIDNTAAIRLTTQELLGCQTQANGSEICSYRPIDNQWIETSWSLNHTVSIGPLGLVKFDESSSEYSLLFKADFLLPEVASKTFSGHMVLVNFNDHGANTANLCKSLQ